MRLPSPTSLHQRLWVVIGLACLPLLLFTFADYHQRRQEAINQLKSEVDNMLRAARVAEDASQRNLLQNFHIMARSDNLLSLESENCSALARRLLQSMPDLDDLGAARPDGQLFCSAQPLPPNRPVHVADRSWFQDAHADAGMTEGDFIISRTTARPSMVFGYPVRDASGQLLAVLYASLTSGRFDNLMRQLQLPDGWNALILSTDGALLAYYPISQAPAQPRPEHSQAFVQALKQGQRLAELTGLDGQLRMYGVSRLHIAKTSIVVAMGAPLDRSRGQIDREFALRLLALLLLTLLSMLLARYYIYALLEAWVQRTSELLRRLGSGHWEARQSSRADVRELQHIEDGIHHMAAMLQRRESDLRRLSTAVEQSPVAMMITDPQANIQYVNPAFERTTGYNRAEVQGRNPNLLNHGHTPSATHQTMWQTLQAGQIWRGEFNNFRKDGSSYLEQATISPIIDAQGHITHFVAAMEDITARRQAEQTIERLAYYDQLTGLPNRSLLQQRLQPTPQDNTHPAQALLLFDIDRFKQINDTWSHGVGDALLRQITQRLQLHTPGDASLARLGSNTFALLLPLPGESRVSALAAAMALTEQIHQSLSQSYPLEDGQKLYATFSAGIALADAGQTQPRLLQQAEVALYRAKASGGDSVLLFDAAMQAQVDARVTLEMGMRQALETGQFALHYQAQVDDQAHVLGAEALLRWPQGPEGKPVSPADFIPLAEDTGLIVPLGLWVLEQACAQLARWQSQAATRQLRLAVNISARQFHQADFVAQVQTLLTQHAIAPHRLTLELTESVFLGDVDHTVARMQSLRALGIRLALDDFGTGYSSLSYLRRLPFDELKIDQSFTRHMLGDPASEAIVCAIMRMSSALRLEVIAEGVETAEQQAFLLSQHCQGLQGYFFGRPMAIDAWERTHLSPPSAHEGEGAPQAG